MHYAIARIENDFTVEFNGENMTFSDYDSLVDYVNHADNESVFIRDDRMVSNGDNSIDALHDFASMNRDENRVIHARAHSRRNAFRECAYCVRDFISPDDFADENEAMTFVRPINSRMSHDSCTHEKTKNARAKCRRERRKNDSTELANDGIEIVTAE